MLFKVQRGNILVSVQSCQTLQSRLRCVVDAFAHVDVADVNCGEITAAQRVRKFCEIGTGERDLAFLKCLCTRRVQMVIYMWATYVHTPRPTYLLIYLDT